MHKAKIFIIVSLLTFLPLLSGCVLFESAPGEYKASKDMEKSKQAYTSCLEQNATDVSKCDTLKQIYEADLAAYRATQAQ